MEFYKEKTSKFHHLKVIAYLFNPELKYEEEGNAIMVDVMKLTKNSLYGQSIRKDIDEEYIIRPENWFLKKNDERVVDYESLPTGDYVRYKSDPGVNIIKEVERSMHSHLGIFVLSHSKRFMHKFVHEIDGFYSNKVYYQDNDSLYIHMNDYDGCLCWN